MKHILALLSVLKAGNEFSNVTIWKSAQFWVSVITALFGILSSLGLAIDVTDESINGFVIVIAALLNAFVTVGSSKRAGF